MGADHLESFLERERELLTLRRETKRLEALRKRLQAETDALHTSETARAEVT